MHIVLAHFLLFLTEIERSAQHFYMVNGASVFVSVSYCCICCLTGLTWSLGCAGYDWWLQMFNAELLLFRASSTFRHKGLSLHEPVIKTTLSHRHTFSMCVCVCNRCLEKQMRKEVGGIYLDWNTLQVFTWAGCRQWFLLLLLSAWSEPEVLLLEMRDRIKAFLMGHVPRV